MIQYTDFLYGCYRTALKDARTHVLLLLLLILLSLLLLLLLLLLSLLLLFCYEELSLVKD